MSYYGEIAPISGEVIKIIDTQGVSKSGNQWRRRTVVVRRIDDFITAIETWGDGIDPNLKEGDKVSCECNVTSQEYNGRWYTKASTHRIVIMAAEQPPVATMPDSLTNYQQHHPQPQPVMPPFSQSASAPTALYMQMGKEELPF